MISYGRTAYREANLFDFCHPHWVFSLQLNETKWVQVEVISDRSLIVLSKSNRICSTQWTDGQEKREKFQVHTCSLDCLVLWEKKPVAQNGIINRHDHNWESAHIVTCFRLSHPYWLLMTSWAWENATMGRKDRIWEAQASTNRPIKLISEVGTAIKYWSFSAFASACKVTLLVSASILRGVEGSGIRYSDPPNHGSDSPHRSCHISLDFRNLQVLRIQSEPEKSEILERQRRDQDIKLSLYPYIVSPRNVCQSSHRTLLDYELWVLDFSLGVVCTCHGVPRNKVWRQNFTRWAPIYALFTLRNHPLTQLRPETGK